MLHALVVDDELVTVRYLSKFVEKEGFSVQTAGTFAEGRAQLQRQPPDVLLVDLILPDGRGLDLLEGLEDRTRMEVVVITGHASIDSAVECLQQGACDYLTKPIDTQRLKAILRNIVRLRSLREEIDDLRTKLRSLGHFGLLLGNSPAIQEVYDLIIRVAPTEATVMVTGESGTGKELVAQTLHNFSRRRNRPFLSVNCASLPAATMEVDLFGQEVEAPGGGGLLQHRGYFERVAGGSLFLDEITAIPLELQVKLLRLLETGSFLRMGADKEVQADVRVIALSSMRPEESIAAGKLREDLFYRLNVFSIHLPPLRERRDDIDLLAGHFLAELNKREGTSKRFNRQTLERLRSYAWPGNVRELKNVIERAFILSDDEILVASLPRDMVARAEAPASDLTFKVGTPLADIEKQTILATLAQYQGNKKKTSEVLGINLRTLYNRLHAYKAMEPQEGPGRLPRCTEPLSVPVPIPVPVPGSR